jgi:cytochrome c oxidase subunit IV
MAEEKKEQSAWGYVVVWVGLVVLTVTTWVLGTKLKLGPYSLPASLVIALVKTVLVAMFFMHLVEQPGARRVVLPVSALFLSLLLGLSLLEAMTRVRMARPDGGQPPAPGAHSRERPRRGVSNRCRLPTSCTRRRRPDC